MVLNATIDPFFVIQLQGLSYHNGHQEASEVVSPCPRTSQTLQPRFNLAITIKYDLGVVVVPD